MHSTEHQVQHYLEQSGYIVFYSYICNMAHTFLYLNREYTHTHTQRGWWERERGRERKRERGRGRKLSDCCCEHASYVNFCSQHNTRLEAGDRQGSSHTAGSSSPTHFCSWSSSITQPPLWLFKRKLDFLRQSSTASMGSSEQKVWRAEKE